MMRRFDRIVNDDSDNSNVEGGENQEAPFRERESAIEQQRELEFSKLIERSLGRGLGGAGRGASGLSDANFLSSSIRLGSNPFDRPPIFEPVASDSGQEEIEALDDINLAAIEQEMLEAGYSQSEIRASL